MTMNAHSTDEKSLREAQEAAAAFELCGIVLQAEISAEAVGMLAARDESALVIEVSGDLARSCLECLDVWRASVDSGDLEEETASLGREWFRLFAGPGKPAAPPWASYYTDKDSALFGADTMRARAWYRRYGLEIERKNSEPDDHVGLLLVFLAHLTHCEAKAIDAGSADDIALARREQVAFMEECLLPWVTRWAELVEGNARSPFYAGFTRIAVGTMLRRHEVLSAALR